MLAPQTPTNGEPRTKMSMGQHCELMVKEWKIPREAQDLLAYESHKKAAAAYDAGFYDDLIVPFAGLERDNNLRPDITLEKLASLGPAFERKIGRAHVGTTVTNAKLVCSLLLEKTKKERKEY